MKDKIIDSVCVGISTVLTITQTNEVFQLISLILTVVSTLVIISYNIYKWYIHATKDGVIDSKEIKELENIIKHEEKK